MSPVFLTEIRRLDDERKFRLAWDDGHEAILDYNYVRGFCPCAMCQGHGASEIVFHQPKGSVRPSGIDPVGHYGVSIVWSDGHATGIYGFDFLREISTREKQESSCYDQARHN